MADPAPSTRPGWGAPAGRVVAVVVVSLALAGPWVRNDRMPPGDFAGYAAVIREVHDDILRYGRVPAWQPRQYGGTSAFLSRLKEHAAFPLTLIAEPLVATKIMFVLAKIGAWLAFIALFRQVFGAPWIGFVAGYAYAFATGMTTNLEHLEVHVSAVLFPLALLALVRTQAGDGRLAGAALGALAACQLSVSQVQCLVLGLLCLLVVALRPTAAGRLSRVAVAAGVGALTFFAFASSPLLWVALDARNHALLPRPADAALYTEKSPLLYLARAGWLPHALEACLPQKLGLAAEDPAGAGRHYLGIVGLLVVVGGWWSARGDRELRRWLQFGALLLLAQMWLATGTATHLDQLVDGCGWGSEAGSALRRAFTVAGIAGALVALLATAGRAWRRLRPFVPPWAEELLLASLVLLGSAHALFPAVRSFLPPLRELRSPGHFVDLAPFAMAISIGVGLLALSRGRRRSGVLVAALGAAIALDHWPAMVALERGAPMDGIRVAQDLLRDVLDDGETSRVSISGYWPLGDYLVGSTDAGLANGWLAWQGGRYWPTFVLAALNPAAQDADARSASDALASIGRIRWVLSAADAPTTPWHLRARSPVLTVGERPDVQAPAAAYRRFAVRLVAGEADDQPLHRLLEAHLGGRLLARHRLLLSLDPGNAETLPGADAVDLAAGPIEVAAGDVAPAPRPVGYQRPAPDHIVLASDEPAPAMVVVSEGYHPWWRARVDGVDTPTYRAVSALIAVPVAAGEHTTDLRFEPPLTLRVADAVLGLAWAALACVAGIVLARGVCARITCGIRHGTRNIR